MNIPSPVKILGPVLDLLQRRHRRLDFLRLGNEGVCGCKSGQTKGFAVVKADKEVVCHTCSERYKRLLSAVILCNSFLWPSACTQWDYITTHSARPSHSSHLHALRLGRQRLDVDVLRRLQHFGDLAQDVVVVALDPGVSAGFRKGKSVRHYLGKEPCGGSLPFLIHLALLQVSF